MKFELSIIQFPNGLYGFVGSVPWQLAYVSIDNGFINASIIESELHLPSKYRTIKTRTWLTKGAAKIDALILGYSVK